VVVDPSARHAGAGARTPLTRRAAADLPLSSRHDRRRGPGLIFRCAVAPGGRGGGMWGWPGGGGGGRRRGRRLVNNRAASGGAADLSIVCRSHACVPIGDGEVPWCSDRASSRSACVRACARASGVNWAWCKGTVSQSAIACLLMLACRAAAAYRSAGYCASLRPRPPATFPADHYIT